MYDLNYDLKRRVVGAKPPAFYDAGYNAGQASFFTIAFRVFAALTVALTLFNLYLEIFAARPLPAEGWQSMVALALESAGRIILLPLSANLHVTPDETVSRWAAGLSPFLLALLFGLIGVMRRNRDY